MIYNNEELKDDILNILDENQELYSALNDYNSYEYHYCLSYLRENLFLWYPFKNNANLLEIGAGCGQLTNLFCNKLDKVVSVENDDELHAIISKRCTADNLTILKNDFAQIETDEKFDYIVLCDIFEYGKHFFNTQNSYPDYLKYLKGFLKEDGVILIAISNRLGLKYFSGFKEEHVDKYFIGVDGFPNIDYVQTFSKPELENIIEQAGFSNYRFYYPYPDHHFPDVICTDEFVNKIPYGRAPVYYDQRSVFFREHKFNQTLANDNLSQYFSNSFLVEIKNNDNKIETEDIKYIKLNNNRAEKFRTITVIHDDNGMLNVTKSPISPLSKNHVRNMHDAVNYDFGKIKFLDNTFDGENFTYPFIERETLENHLIDAIIANDEEKFYDWMESFYDALFYDSFLSNDYASDEFLEIFGEESHKEFHCHNITNLDVIFNNLFIIDDEFVAIDYEWLFQFPIPLEYIFYRVIRHHNVTNPLFRDFASINDIFIYFNLDEEDIELFKSWELNFASWVYSGLIRPKVKRTSKWAVNNLDDFDSINRELNTLKNSKSWKITKPLRKIMSLKRR